MMSAALGRPKRAPTASGYREFVCAGGGGNSTLWLLYIPRSAYTLLTRAQPPCQLFCHRGNPLYSIRFAHPLLPSPFLDRSPRSALPPILILHTHTHARACTHGPSFSFFLSANTPTYPILSFCLSLSNMRACVTVWSNKQSVATSSSFHLKLTRTYIYVYLILRVGSVCVCHLRPSCDVRTRARVSTLFCGSLQSHKVQSSFWNPSLLFSAPTYIRAFSLIPHLYRYVVFRKI